MSKYRRKDISCKNKKCFAYYKGVCNILNDTNFKGKPCPFFKEKEDEKS